MTAAFRLPLLTTLAQEAGTLALSRQSEAAGLMVDQKARLDFVTNADREVETLVAARVTEAFAEDGFLGEEGRRTAGQSGYTWIVDPIDGTHNFLRGGRDWAVSLAVLGPDTRAAAIAVPSAGLVLTAGTGQPPAAEW